MFHSFVQSDSARLQYIGSGRNDFRIPQISESEVIYDSGRNATCIWNTYGIQEILNRTTDPFYAELNSWIYWHMVGGHTEWEDQCIDDIQDFLRRIFRDGTLELVKITKKHDWNIGVDIYSFIMTGEAIEKNSQ